MSFLTPEQRKLAQDSWIREKNERRAEQQRVRFNKWIENAAELESNLTPKEIRDALAMPQKKYTKS